MSRIPNTHLVLVCTEYCISEFKCRKPYKQLTLVSETEFCEILKRYNYNLQATSGADLWYILEHTSTHT